DGRGERAVVQRQPVEDALAADDVDVGVEEVARGTGEVDELRRREREERDRDGDADPRAAQEDRDMVEGPARGASSEKIVGAGHAAFRVRGSRWHRGQW